MANDDVLFVEDELPANEQDAQEIAELVTKLESRCKAARITFTRPEPAYDGEAYTKIDLPSGRDHKTYYVRHSKESINKFLNTEFENYTFISGFEAIFDKKKQDN